MPLYEYVCRACAHRFERIVKFSDAPLKTCPNCKKDEIEQVISAPAVQFKGSGWYVTDYARKNSTPALAATKSDSGSDTTATTKDTASTGEGASTAAKSSSSDKPASSTAGESKSPASSTTKSDSK